MKTLCLIYLLLLSYLPHIVSQQIDLEADFKKLDDAILKKDSYINKKQQENYYPLIVFGHKCLTLISYRRFKLRDCPAISYIRLLTYFQ